VRREELAQRVVTLTDLERLDPPASVVPTLGTICLG
jgi:hypothetical protein